MYSEAHFGIFQCSPELNKVCKMIKGSDFCGLPFQVVVSSRFSAEKWVSTQSWVLNWRHLSIIWHFEFFFIQLHFLFMVLRCQLLTSKKLKQIWSEERGFLARPHRGPIAQEIMINAKCSRMEMSKPLMNQIMTAINTLPDQLNWAHE